MKADLLNLSIDTSGVSYGAPIADSISAVSARITKATELLKGLSTDTTSLELIGQIRDAHEQLRTIEAAPPDSGTIARKIELERRMDELARELESHAGLSREMIHDVIDAYDATRGESTVNTEQEEER